MQTYDVEDFLPLCRAIAGKFCRRYRLEHYLDDAKSEAYQACFVGLPGFDPERGLTVEQYIGVCVRYALIDFFRSIRVFTRTAGEPMPQVYSLDEEHEAEGGPLGLKESAAVGVEPRFAERVIDQLTVAKLIELSGVTPRDRTLLRLYYWDGKTMSETAVALGVSDTRASQMHAKAMEKLRTAAGPARAEEVIAFLTRTEFEIGRRQRADVAGPGAKAA